MLTLQFSLFPLLSYLVYTNQPLKKNAPWCQSGTAPGLLDP